jgi:hypothetical protein
MWLHVPRLLPRHKLKRSSHCQRPLATKVKHPHLQVNPGSPAVLLGQLAPPPTSGQDRLRVYRKGVPSLAGRTAVTARAWR